MAKEKSFTEVFRCRHCGNSAPMEIVAAYNDAHEHFDENSAYHWEQGTSYQLARCPACQKISFRHANWHDGFPEDTEYEVDYPEAAERNSPRGIPEAVNKAFQAAVKVRSIDANAYSVLLGRVLEIVCGDRKAVGKTLSEKLRDLSTKGEIPGRLVEVAHGLRAMRNVGAHADLGELTEAEVPVLDNLTRAILEYVYAAPLLVKDAEDCLKKLGERRAKPQKKSGEADKK